MKTILKIISAPFRFVAWFIREILIFILNRFYDCSVMLPRQSKYIIRKGKKHGK